MEVSRSDTFYRDMERNPEMYKEHIEEHYDVEPDYPTTEGYMLVDHGSMAQMGGEKPCFHCVDDAVMWAENNLDHNCYNVYKLEVVL